MPHEPFWSFDINPYDPFFIPIPTDKEEETMPIDQVLADQIAASSLQSHTKAMTDREFDANFSSKALEAVVVKKFDEIQTLESGAASRIMFAPPPNRPDNVGSGV